MAQLLSMGELLIDFTPVGQTEDGRLLFARNPGGAPANVAVQAQRAGVSAGFLGRVGQDMFGDFLVKTLQDCGIETAGLSQDPDHATTLAFVQLNDQGDRDFSFYRNPGADTRLAFEGVDLSLLDQCSLLCFGSLLLTAEPSRSAVEQLVAYAKEQGKITAYDPNWRPPLWKGREDEGVRRMKSLIPLADIMKVSDEELALITGEGDLAAGAKALLDQGVSLVVVTQGAQGLHRVHPGLLLCPAHLRHPGKGHHRLRGQLLRGRCWPRSSSPGKSPGPCPSRSSPPSWTSPTPRAPPAPPRPAPSPPCPPRRRSRPASGTSPC